MAAPFGLPPTEVVPEPEAVTEDPYAADLSLFDNFVASAVNALAAQDAAQPLSTPESVPLDQYLGSDLGFGFDELEELGPGYELVLEAEDAEPMAAAPAAPAAAARSVPPAPPMPAFDEDLAAAAPGASAAAEKVRRLRAELKAAERELQEKAIAAASATAPSDDVAAVAAVSGRDPRTEAVLARARALAGAAAPGGGTFPLIAAAAGAAPSGEAEANARAQARHRARVRAEAREASARAKATAAKDGSGAAAGTKRPLSAAAAPAAGAAAHAPVFRQDVGMAGSPASFEIPPAKKARASLVKCEVLDDDEVVGGFGGHGDEERIWTVFVDELEMPRRPAVEPGSGDREVFAKWLPQNFEAEAGLKSWIADEFHLRVESAYLLRDELTGAPKGSAYIRFLRHEDAALFVDVESEAVQWSEAERAAQGARGAYAADLHEVFVSEDGRARPELVKRCGAAQIWIQSDSEEHGPRGMATGLLPPPASGQLHFSVACRRSQLEDAQVALGAALQEFHESVTLRAPVPPSAIWLGSGAPPVSRRQRQLERLQRPNRPPPPERPLAKVKQELPEKIPTGKNLVWDSASGKYYEEDLPEDLRELVFMGMTCVPGTGSATWSPGVKTELSDRSMSGRLGGVKMEPFDNTRPSPRPRAKGVPPAASPLRLEALMARGEAAVARGRALAQACRNEDAFDKYKQGIQMLVDAVTALEGLHPGREPEALIALRERLNIVLTEAERLQVITSIEQRMSSSASRTRGPPQLDVQAMERAAHLSDAACREGTACANWGLQAEAAQKSQIGVQHFLKFLVGIALQGHEPAALTSHVASVLSRYGSLALSLQQSGMTGLALKDMMVKAWHGDAAAAAAPDQAWGGPGFCNAGSGATAPRVVPPRPSQFGGSPVPAQLPATAASTWWTTDGTGWPQGRGTAPVASAGDSSGLPLYARSQW